MAFTAPSTSRMSGPASEWTRDITTAPLHPQSGHVVEHLVLQTKVGAPNLNCYQYGLPIYEVTADTARVDVDWTGHTQAGDALYANLLGLDPKKGPYPWPIASYSVLPPSVGAFRGVPIPAGAKPAVGTDAALAVYNVETGELWELWQAKFNATTGRWSAAWGGYLPDVRAVKGQFPGTTGTSASGLVLAPAMVKLKEVERGVIDHAMSLAIPYVVEKAWSYPAVRCDGYVTRNPAAIHEGQRFRLDPTVDVDALLGPADWAGRRYPLHPVARMIAKAAQKYGFIVTDGAGVVAIAAEEGSAAMVATGATVDPWNAALGGKASWAVLAGFPWEKLQALPFDWGKA